MAWKVYWDNDGSACGTLPGEYDTEALAQAAADNWAQMMNNEDRFDPDDDTVYSAEAIWVEPSAALATQHDQYCNCDACKRAWGENA